VDRREFIKFGAGLSLVGDLAHSESLPKMQPQSGAIIKPTWLSFGLNGPAQGVTRFPLTMALASNRKPDFQFEVSQAIAKQLKAAGDIADFKNTTEFNSGTMLGAALDYENVLEARLGSSSFIVLHLVGHGVLLNFDRTRGWKMQSSFPFPVTLLRESQGGNSQAEASKYLVEAYTDGQNSFATSFANAAKRLAPRWKDSDRSFNVRVMSSKIHPEAQGKLGGWGLAKNINDVWLGHLASAAVCESLGIPVVPFVETQALGKFTYKFSERLTAQNVQLPSEADIDLRLHVTLRNVAREIKYRNQFQRWEATRMVVMDVKVLDDQNEEVVALRLGYQDDQPDALAKEEDNSPARDAHFFDMAIYRGLQTLFSGIDKGDKTQLAKVFVKPDAKQQEAIDRFKRQYQKAL
jgi:hypothetical protein